MTSEKGCGHYKYILTKEVVVSANMCIQALELG